MVLLAVLAEIWLERPFAHVAAAGVVAVGLGLLAWFVVHPNASLWSTVVGRGRRGVVLTFDDGPDPETTPAVLELLAKRRVRATFFVIGEKAQAHPELVARIAREGHEVGLHGFDHSPRFHFQLWRGAREDLARASAAVRAATGVAPRYFRPPFGLKNPALGDVVREAGLVHVGWSARGRDGVGATRDEIVRRIAPDLADGAIVLLHDGRDAMGRGDRRETVAALDPLLDEIARRGLAVVSLDEALGADVAAPAPSAS